MRVNVPGNTGSPLVPIPREDKKVEKLPDLPSWEARPIISDLAIDPAGNQYVLYGRYNKLVKYDPSGNVIKALTGAGTSEFRLPLGLAVSPAGDRVYVADTYNNRVLIYDGNLAFIRTIDKTYYIHIDDRIYTVYLWCIKDYSASDSFDEQWDTTFLLPSGLIVDKDNNLIVSDKKHRLLKFDKDGAPRLFSRIRYDQTSYVQYLLKGLGPDFFNELFGTNYHVEYSYVYSNAIGDLLVPNGNFTRVYPIVADVPPGNENGQLCSPESVNVNAFSNIYIADTGNDRLQTFAPSGSFISKHGEGALKSPKGIDIDSYGNIWVADAGNQRIVQLDSGGNQVIEYKSDEYTVDPQKIKVRDGKLYIADAKHNKPLVWNIGGELADLRISAAWFSPNGNSTKGPLKIKYNLTQPADMTLKLVHKGPAGAGVSGTAVATILDQSPRTVGRQEELWDGKVIGTTAADDKPLDPVIPEDRKSVV
jgi:DNA-binding beta-propeller fold protein YncE